MWVEGDSQPAKCGKQILYLYYAEVKFSDRAQSHFLLLKINPIQTKLWIILPLQCERMDILGWDFRFTP